MWAHFSIIVSRNERVCRNYLLADVPKAFDIFGFGLASLLSGLLSAKEDPRPRPVPLEPAPDDMTLRQDIHILLTMHELLRIINLISMKEEQVFQQRQFWSINGGARLASSFCYLRNTFTERSILLCVSRVKSVVGGKGRGGASLAREN